MAERIERALAAGIDQFGGESCPEVLVGLVRDGRVPEGRIDQSAHRLLREKFALGLFEARYVEVARAGDRVGQPRHAIAGRRAQRDSITPLVNRLLGDRPTLPLSPTTVCKVIGFDPVVVEQYASVVDDGSEDVVLAKTAGPHEARAGPFERFHRAGRLDFPADELDRLLELLGDRGVVAIYLDRPAVIPELVDRAAAMVGFCGADDTALLDVIFGRARPRGRLPFDLPRSMAAVEAHQPDRPGGTPVPVLRMGWSADTSAWSDDGSWVGQSTT